MNRPTRVTYCQKIYYRPAYVAQNTVILQNELIRDLNEMHRRFVLASTLRWYLRVFCSDGFPYVIAPAFSTPAFSALPSTSAQSKARMILYDLILVIIVVTGLEELYFALFPM